MTRAEHMDWCKGRAREYLERGDATNAIASMASDLNKHDETRQLGATAGFLALAAGMEGTVEAARRFVEGFN